MYEVQLANDTIELDLEADMRLSDETLDRDLTRLPHTIARYAEILGECQAYASNQKAAADQAEAQADLNIRQAAATAGEKTTEPKIANKVHLDPAVKQARSAYYKAEAQFKSVDGFYRALREKAAIGIALLYKQKEEIRVMNSPLN
jgi:hypothetical protein